MASNVDSWGRRNWGRWATLGLGLIAMLAGQTAALAAVIWWYGVSLTHLLNLASDGVVATLIICISTPVQVLVLAMMARQAGSSAAEYLGLTLPRRGDVVTGIIVVFVFIVLVDGISWLSGRDLVTPFQLDMYRTASAAGWLPWLLLTTVVVAPIGEDTFSRFSVSRLAPLQSRCLGRDHRDRAALGPRSSAI